jgi:hypothetical protein
MAHKIMCKRPLFGSAVHEHRDCGSHPFVDVDHEDFFLVPNKNRPSGIEWQDRSQLHGDDGFIHEARTLDAFRANDKGRGGGIKPEGGLTLREFPLRSGGHFFCIDSRHVPPGSHISAPP